MRSTLVCAAVLAMLSVSASAHAQQPDQPQQPPVNEDKIKEPKAAVDKTPPPPPVPSTQIGAQPAGDSLAAAARKAREAKKDQSQAGTTRVFDNDTIPKKGGVSAVGATDDAAAAGSDGSASDGAAAPAPAAGAASGELGEKAWRDRFAKLRTKLQQDEDALSVMQRELGVLDVQYYNDPNKALQQNLTRSDINAKTAKIDAGKQAVEADKQAISDAEDELRKSGGDIGWAR
jgi:hypothetical protein